MVIGSIVDPNAEAIRFMRPNWSWGSGSAPAGPTRAAAATAEKRAARSIGFAASASAPPGPVSAHTSTMGRNRIPLPRTHPSLRWSRAPRDAALPGGLRLGEARLAGEERGEEAGRPYRACPGRAPAPGWFRAA